MVVQYKDLAVYFGNSTLQGILRLLVENKAPLTTDRIVFHW